LTGLLTTGKFLQLFVSTSVFQVSKLRDFPHQLTLIFNCQIYMYFYCLFFLFRIPQYTLRHYYKFYFP